MPRKPRILCLHGFTSNGTVHAHQVRHLTSLLANTYEFIFPSGPHVIPLSSPSDPTAKLWAGYVSSVSNEGHRAWWDWEWPSETQPGGAIGLETSLESVADLIRKTGPVQGIWGFSQGACFAGMLVGLLGEENRNHPLRQLLPKEQGTPPAGVFFSGFRASADQYDSIYKGIRIPTLHIMGANDAIVKETRSMILVGLCEGSKVVKHQGGHDVPKGQVEVDAVVDFLRDTLKTAGEESL